MAKHHITIDFDDATGDIQVEGVPNNIVVATFMAAALSTLVHENIAAGLGLAGGPEKRPAPPPEKPQPEQGRIKLLRPN